MGNGLNCPAQSLFVTKDGDHWSSYCIQCLVASFLPSINHEVTIDRVHSMGEAL